MGCEANEVCHLKSIAILKVYDNLENPCDSHEYQECVCIQLYFVLICIDLIPCVTFIFFCSVDDARCPSIKTTKATGRRSHSQGMTTMTPCLLMSLMFPSVLLGLCFLTTYGFSVIQGGVERWRPRGKLQGQKGRRKGSLTTQGSPGKQDRTNRDCVNPLVWVRSHPAVW